MLPEWVWILSVFIFGTAMFFVGHYTGRIDAERAPSENAWVNVRRYGIDANKEIAILGIRNEHEEQMEMINRGIYDTMNVGLPPEDEDETDLTV